MLNTPEEHRILANTEQLNILHIYAQGFHHDDAQIAGTRDALIRLRDAIDVVLQTETEDYKITCEADFFTSDGKGYITTVICLPEKVVSNLQPPYTDFFPRVA